MVATNPVGYLVNHDDHMTGERGIGLDYVMAKNGLFVTAENDQMAAWVQVADAEVRGLGELSPVVMLTHGKIPGEYFELALAFLLAEPDIETYVAITWEDGQYAVHVPDQDQGAAHLKYQRPENVVFEMHSHPGMSARFSGTDNADETGLGIYGVVGWRKSLLSMWPVYDVRIRIRVGVYGYFWEVGISEIFEGHVTAKEAEEDVLTA